MTVGQDTNLLAQRHTAWAVKGGISLFTRGEAKDSQRAVQDTGLKLHAASGSVNTQAQSGPFTLTALKGIDLQSTGADVVISAPSKIVLNGGGGYVKIEGGDIEIGTSGKASFNASMKLQTMYQQFIEPILPEAAVFCANPSFLLGGQEGKISEFKFLFSEVTRDQRLD